MNKKRNIFLIIIAYLLISTLKVQAENATFYEAEYIDNIYMNKEVYKDHTIYYQKARFFRKTGTNEFAYCLEPFRFFNEGSTYESKITPSNLTPYRLDEIKRIAYFGYGYKDHTDPKWYAITQLLIWQEADTSGDYYFTNSLNGNRVYPYQNEIIEINKLVTKSRNLPSFSDQTFEIVEGKTLIIEDTNNIINEFKSNDQIEINNNKVIIKDLKEGTYKYNFYKENNNYQKPIIFYESNDSQSLLITGDIENQETSITVNVKKTELQITKIDKDTKSIIPNGEGVLDHALFDLLDKDKNKLETIEIINNEAIIKNLDYGTYYLKEIESGIGYLKNNDEIEINITKDNTIIEVIVENEPIKKKITIHKIYGELSKLESEKNISFQIYNNRKELIKTITTNEEGIAEIILPYGTYEFIQLNSTEGYNKVDPFTVKVETEEDELIELKDLKIEVPNTHISKNIFLTLLEILLIIL